MFVIALTGGIGSGKSEAAKQFSALGIPVIDADVIAHELTAIGKPILEDIKCIFGAGFFNADGSLNRAKLRHLVFTDQAERLKLESIIHPAIHEHALKKLIENESILKPPYQILVIPLLFESNRYDEVIDKILVIDCDESLQIKRAMARSRITESEVKEMMEAQVKRSVRVDFADEVILNNGTLEELRENITKAHKKFIKTCILKQYI